MCYLLTGGNEINDKRYKLEALGEVWRLATKTMFRQQACAKGLVRSRFFSWRTAKRGHDKKKGHFLCNVQ